jgi:hypothetical protein
MKILIVFWCAWCAWNRVTFGLGAGCFWAIRSLTHALDDATQHRLTLIGKADAVAVPGY